MFNNPIQTLDGAIRIAADRGEICGLELAARVPDILLEHFKRSVEEALAVLREDEGENEDGTR